MYLKLLTYLWKSLISTSWFVLLAVLVFLCGGIALVTPAELTLIDAQTGFAIKFIGVLIAILYVSEFYNGAQDMAFWVSKPMSRLGYLTTHFVSVSLFCSTMSVFFGALMFLNGYQLSLSELFGFWLEINVIACFCIWLETAFNSKTLSVLLGVILFGLIHFKEEIINHLFNIPSAGIEFLGYIFIGLSFVIPSFKGDMLIFATHALGFAAFLYVTTLQEIAKKQL